MSSRDPVPLTESLGGVLRSLRGPESSGTAAGAHGASGGAGGAGGGASVRALGDVFGRWNEAVGAAVSRHVQPVKLDGRRLVVEVDDPAWATQLRFLESTVLARLREEAGAEIDQLEIRVKRR